MKSKDGDGVVFRRCEVIAEIAKFRGQEVENGTRYAVREMKN